MISNLLVGNSQPVDEVSAPDSDPMMDNQVVDQVSAMIAIPLIAGKLNVLAHVSDCMKSPHETAMPLKACVGNKFPLVNVKGCFESVKGHLVQAVIWGK